MSAPPIKVLVIDDEPPIRKLLRMGLSTQGYEIVEAPNGKVAMEKLSEDPALIILDLGLPDIQGHELLRSIRSRNESVPIVVLSSRGDEAGKVQALDLGADDYLTKPFGMDELLARMRAALRHQLQIKGERPVFRTGDLSVDLVRRIVKLGERNVKLSPKEYDLLRVLFALCSAATSFGLTLPKATIAACGGCTRGVAQAPPSDPMLETVSVAPQRSASGRSPPPPPPSADSSAPCSLASSVATSATLRSWTRLTTGTTSPLGVSTATPMLWSEWSTRESLESESDALTTAWCSDEASASEIALTTNGSSVSFVPCSFGSLARALRASISLSTGYSSMK